ncbi:MAG: hypothetical protein QOK10_2331 [Pseudonocardiales bacterium]|jgi:hypothetical protein|nr:hypothetical protein [Pseudonocardiales bacterium]
MIDGRQVGRKSLSGSGDSPQIRVRVSAEVMTVLEHLAEQEGTSKSMIVRSLVERELADRSAQPPRPEVAVQLELHRRIIPKLLQDPESIRAIARRNLEQARSRRQSPMSQEWIDEWQRLIDGPDSELIQMLIKPGEHAIDMRQMSPFAGALSDAERMEAIVTGRALAKA